MNESKVNEQEMESIITMLLSIKEEVKMETSKYECQKENFELESQRINRRD